MSDHYDIPYPVDTGLAHTTLKYVHVETTSAPVQSQYTQSIVQAWTTSVYGNCTLERGYLNMNIY